MTDLVERLRKRRIGEPWDYMMVEEAADEILALRRTIDIAWAAGLFEGEGAICTAQKFKAILNEDGQRRKSGLRWWMVIHSTDHDVLHRFHKIIGVGRMYGPYLDKRGDHYKPQLRWATTTLADAQSAARLLLPYLGERRAAKARECLEAVYVRRNYDPTFQPDPDHHRTQA
jgi:hypothetical protein